MTYRVKIRQEGTRWVARDERGHARAWGRVDQQRTGRRLAEYLFHADEVGTIKASEEATEVEILSFSGNAGEYDG